MTDHPTKDRGCPICKGDWQSEEIGKRITVHAPSCPWATRKAGTIRPITANVAPKMELWS